MSFPSNTLGGNTRAKGKSCGGLRAFTLIEMMIVMVVIITLVALSMPSVNSLLTGRTLSGSIDRTWSAMAAARQQAIARQTPVALVLGFASTRLKTNPKASDAFILMAAKPPQTNSASALWSWPSVSAWMKLPKGVQITAGQTDSTSAGTTDYGFLTNALPAGSSTQAASAPAVAWPSSFTEITKYLPTLEGDQLRVEDYCFIIFHPDGSVDSSLNKDSNPNPYLQFKRLNANTKPDPLALGEFALVLSQDSGRPRLVQY